MTCRGLLALAAIAYTAICCTKRHEPAPVSPAVSSQQDNIPPPVELVDATILLTDCGTVSNVSAKQAEKTMRQLVEACSEVPGGTAQFTATLLPGGRVELTTPDAGLQMVPTCVLSHALTHRVVLKRACSMQVQMSERKAATMALPSASANGNAPSAVR
jgi:hypothetical protein